MTYKQPNQIVSALFKQFNELDKVKDADKYDWKAQIKLKEELIQITKVVGAVEVMSKLNILRLIKMQCSLRFMQEHKFYRPFADACDDITNK